MDYLRSTLEEMENHKVVALEVSGGRDSIAAYRLLGKLPDNVFIVFLDTADTPTETLDRMFELNHKHEGHFVWLNSSSFKTRRDYGHPLPLALSDLPIFSSAPPTQTQFDCCTRSIMIPMHNAVVSLGATMIIRGVRDTDVHKSPVKHMDYIDGIRYAYPVYDRTDEDINIICSDMLPSFYEHMTTAPDCLTCTGYWGTGHQKWLDVAYPVLATERRERITALLSYIEPVLRIGFKEIE